MIVQIGDFKNEAKIAGLFPETSDAFKDFRNEAIKNSVESFIEKYEPEFFTKLLGEDYAKEIKDYAELPEIEKTVEWKNKMICDLRTPCAYYISYYYKYNDTPTETTIGAVNQQGENGYRVDRTKNLIKIWNDMVDMLRNTDWLYRDYMINDLLKKRNQFGI